MEIFQSKLEEAEKTASTKEDCKRERWRKPTYAEKAQSSQESRKSDLVKYNKNSRDRYHSTNITNSTNKEKFSGDEKDNRSGSLETCRRQSSQRQNQEFSSFGNLKPKFLRPSDDEELSFHSKGRNFKPSCSSSALVDHGFRKPTENSEESSSSWSQSDVREENRKCSHQRSLETGGTVDHGNVSDNAREESRDESLRDDSLKKEHLQDTLSPFAGYFVICFLS